MSDLLVAFNPAAPAGSRFAPEVVAEIEEVAPSLLDDGDVTEPKLADESVSTRTFQPGAVDTVAIGAGEVKNINVDTNTITGDRMVADTITPRETGTGVVAAFDDDDNAISLRIVPIASADYTALAVKDPNTLYATF